MTRYDHSQALSDFEAVALAAGLDPEDITHALSTADLRLHPIRSLRALFRSVTGADGALRRRNGDLYVLCFGASDDELDAYDLSQLDEFIAPLLEDATVLGVAGLDAWVEDKGGHVWRVHPEDCVSLGPSENFMRAQVTAALTPR